MADTSLTIANTTNAAFSLQWWDTTGTCPVYRQSLVPNGGSVIVTIDAANAAQVEANLAAYGATSGTASATPGIYYEVNS